MALVTAAAARAVASPRTTGWEIVRRNFTVYRSSWLVFLTGFLEPVLYLFSIGIGVGQLVTGFEFNGQVVVLRRVRGAGDAGGLGDERRDPRLDVRHLLQAPLRQGLRRRARHPDAHRRHRPRRAGLVADALRGLLRRLPRGDGRDGAGVVVVGGAGLAGDLADRLRVRRRGDGADDVHEVLAGLRVRPARDRPDVPVLRDVLPGHRLRRRAALGGRGDAALPRRDADPRADHRRAHRRLAGGRWSTSSRWGSVGLAVASRRFDRLLLT